MRLVITGKNSKVAIDYGYGMRNSTLLARGVLIGGVGGDCDRYPGRKCPAELSFENPDNSAFVATGKI